jgi:quinol monooxygenase YgiN
VAAALAEGRSNTPFGLATRGSNAYVTFAGSDTVGVVKNGRETALAATGIPGGAGQHAPCWIAVVGPYLFTTNSPSHSVSRLVAAGATVLLDDPVAAQTSGAPIDVDAEGDLLALVESDGGGVSHLTQFRIGEDGTLTGIVSTPIATAPVRQPRLRGGVEMVTLGLFVRLSAKPGRSLQLEQFLRSALSHVENEPDTVAWFALKLGPSSFGIFDAFPHDAARQAHLAGAVAAALMARAADLLAAPPQIEYVDTLASKLPRGTEALVPAGPAGADGRRRQ